jgi:hypothetical protein
MHRHLEFMKPTTHEAIYGLRIKHVKHLVQKMASRTFSNHGIWPNNIRGISSWIIEHQTSGRGYLLHSDKDMLEKSSRKDISPMRLIIVFLAIAMSFDMS